jgi:hypothetical protein
MAYKTKEKNLAYLREWRKKHPNYSRDWKRKAEQKKLRKNKR